MNVSSAIINLQLNHLGDVGTLNQDCIVSHVTVRENYYERDRGSTIFQGCFHSQTENECTVKIESTARERFQLAEILILKDQRSLEKIYEEARERDRCADRYVVVFSLFPACLVVFFFLLPSRSYKFPCPVKVKVPNLPDHFEFYSSIFIPHVRYTADGASTCFSRRVMLRDLPSSFFFPFRISFIVSMGKSISFLSSHFIFMLEGILFAFLLGGSCQNCTP